MTSTDVSNAARTVAATNGAPRRGKQHSRANDALNRFHEESQITQSYDARMLLRLWPFVKPHSLYLIGSIGLLLVAASMALLRPLIMRWAFDGFDAPDASSR